MIKYVTRHPLPADSSACLLVLRLDTLHHSGMEVGVKCTTTLRRITTRSEAERCIALHYCFHRDKQSISCTRSSVVVVVATKRTSLEILSSTPQNNDSGYMGNSCAACAEREGESDMIDDVKK